MATRMFAAKQLLEALEALHNCGIVHRDLDEKNCMWGMSPFHDLTRSAKYRLLGRPLKGVISVEHAKQGELVSPAKFPDNLRTEDFYLGDFSLAMKLGDTVIQQGYPPAIFCSPDRPHKESPSIGCDMWSYMVIFAELYLGFPPFPTQFDGGIVTGIVRTLGPLPEQWKGQYVNPNGALDSWYDQYNKPDPENELRAVIAQRRPDADFEEQKIVHSILSRGFSYCPGKRPTASQLLRDPSFRAIMEKYGC
ncbi:STYKc [Aspergillus sclerotialis]|uniref:STYKc n=1 Tax=Aspergillus sclerotialis TaxID=2070753 RepID=A0A3A2ZJ47_9EURO|nr:STYKc [Aspergillus sclerotialis]